MSARLAAVVLIMLTLAQPLRVHAEDPAPPLARWVPRGDAVAEVIVKGVTALRLRGPDAHTRAAEVVRRVLVAIAAGGGEPVLTVVDRKSGTQVRANGVLIVTVSAADAQANRMKPRVLAQRWAAQLHTAMTYVPPLPPLRLEPGRLVLKPGEVAWVAVFAQSPGRILIGPHDLNVAVARVWRDKILVEARDVGQLDVSVSVGDFTATIRVVVRVEAGAVPAEVTVRVTGDQPGASLIQEAVERRLDQAIVRRAGATLTIGPFPPVDGTLPVGGPLLLTVPVTLRSPYHLPVEAMVRVTVMREMVEFLDPQVLLVSNRPECVDANGVLFEEVVEAGHAMRLLYHHQNGTPNHSRILWVALANHGATPARLLLTTGLAGPSPDPLFVGFAATTRFLQNLAASRGYIVEVPPRSEYAFTAQTMLPLQLVSGILQAQLLEGDRLEIKVQIRSPWLLERTVTSAVNQPAHPHPKGTFRGPTVALTRNVEATTTSSLLNLGITAGLRDVRTGDLLVGDYGVVYRLTAQVTNPRLEDMTVDVVSLASGGLVRGIFLINGQVIETPMLRPYQEHVVASFTVGGFETQTITLVTMPAAGSYFPLRVTLRPRDATSTRSVPVPPVRRGPSGAAGVGQARGCGGL